MVVLRCWQAQTGDQGRRLGAGVAQRSAQHGAMAPVEEDGRVTPVQLKRVAGAAWLGGSGRWRSMFGSTGGGWLNVVENCRWLELMW
jgi:hypothetical protein